MCSSDSEIEEVGAPHEPTVRHCPFSDRLCLESPIPCERHSTQLFSHRLQIDFDLTRLAVGKKVCHAECQASLDPASMELELRYKNTQRTTTRTRTDDSDGYVTVRLMLRDGSLAKIILYEGSDEPEATVTETDDCVEQLGPLVALHMKATIQNGLEKFRRHLAPDNENPNMRYLVLELRDKDDWKRIGGLLSRLPFNVDQIVAPPKKKIRKYAGSLLADNRNRRRTTKRNAFLDGRPSDYALLVYPFGGDPTEIEKAADGLTEAAGAMKIGEAVTLATPSECEDDGDGKSRHRAHFVTITVEDYDRLDPGEWLNDSLVDLWMQWYVGFDRPSAREDYF
jgi:hypothetical protein